MPVPAKRFAKQTHFTFRGPGTRDWSNSARRLVWKVQLVVASIDVAQGRSCALRASLQNKPNLPTCPSISNLPEAAEQAFLAFPQRLSDRAES